MMKFLEITKFIFVSFEFLFLISIIALMNRYPQFFVMVGDNFQINDEIWKFLPSIPLVICGFSVRYAWRILMPISNGSNRILHEWPNYWSLKYRVLVSIFICAACVVGSLVIWFFSSILPSATIGATFIGSCVISVTVALNQLFAAFKVRELIEP